MSVRAAAPTRIEAVTFDFWDTLVIDDSDELERARRGLPTKEVAREALFVETLVQAYPALGRPHIAAAWAHLQATFRHAWKVEHRTPGVADRLAVGLAHLDVGPPAAWERVIAEFEDMEVDIPPLPAPGVVEALRALHGQYRLGIISDTIITPGRGLRRLLDQMGVLSLFCPSGLIFSDEAGRSKPSPRVFGLACAGLDVRPSALAHVGDREENDVLGPQLFGANGILYTGIVDRGAATSSARGICADLTDLPSLLARLSSAEETV